MKNLMILPALLFSFQIAIAQVQLGMDIPGVEYRDWAGRSLAISKEGNRVAVGAIRNSDNGLLDSGHTRIFEWRNNSWIQMGEAITGLNAQDFSGAVLSMSGDGSRIAIEDINAGTSLRNDGRVRIFEWRDSTWKQMGLDILGMREDEVMGSDISFSQDGNRVAIGAYGHDNEGVYTGRVRVFQWNSVNWVQIGSNIDGEERWDLFGKSLELSADGNHLIVTASGYTDFNPDDTYIKVFEFTNNDWQQIGEKFLLPDLLDQVDVCISSNGQRIAFTHPSRQDKSKVLTYELNNENWVAIDTLFDDSNQDMINVIAMSDDGQVLAAGIFDNNANSSVVWYVQLYHWASGTWQQQGERIEISEESRFSFPVISLSGNGKHLILGDYQYDSQRGRAMVYGLDDIVAVEELPEIPEQFLVFPNPTAHAVQISRALKSNERLLLVGMDGRILKQWSTANTQHFDISDLPSGIYHLLLDDGQQLQKQKIVKQ